MKAKIVTIAGLLVLALAVGGWLFYTHRSHTSAAQAPAISNTATPSTPESTNGAADNKAVADLEKSLNSTDSQTQLDALTPDMREAYKAAGQTRVFPVGVTIHMQPNTFKSNGNYANVDAAIDESGKPGGTYTLMLARNDASSPWLLLDLKQK